MPDPTPPPTPGPSKNPRKRGVWNQAQIQALTKADQIRMAAMKDAYLPKLEAREILDDFLGQLNTDIQNARKEGSDVIGMTTGKETMTRMEDKAKKDLLKALREVQAAANQKYARSTTPEKVQDYLVGTRIDDNRADLEQNSQTMIDHLATDGLPGITVEKKANLVTLRQAYIDANSDQSGGESDMSTGHATLEQMIKSITDRRITIQFAADAEWPFSDPMNRGVRKEFLLPADQPFNG